MTRPIAATMAAVFMSAGLSDFAWGSSFADRNKTASEEAGAIVNACPGDGSFTITANVNPELSGCFIGSTTNDGLLVYTVSGTTSLSEIIIFALETDDGDYNWSIAFIELSNNDESQLYCTSVEAASDVNPGDASWICDFTGDYINLLLATEEDISIVCGSCGTFGGTPEPTASRVPAPTPTPVSQTSPTPVSTPTTPTTAEPASTPAPSLAAGEEAGAIANACPGDGSFTITANANPDLSGCFIGSTTFDGLLVYTVSGTTSVSEIIIFAVETDDGDFYWSIALIELSDNDESELYCTSVEPASDVNPGDASWICDFTGDYINLLLATEDDISIVCGSCGTVGGTPEPTPSPVPAPTPTPVSQISPTPVSTPITPTTAEPTSIPASSPAAGEEAGAIVKACPGDGSFTITANANPDLSGCFFGSTTNDGLLVVYTVSGTTSLSEIIIFAVETDDGDFNWSIAFIDLSDNDESQLYCTSVEQASDVNPGDASWICDFTGDYINLLLTTEEDIAIVCGSCAVFGTPEPTLSQVPPPTPTPPSVGGSPLASDTCSGDGSFTITASAAPNLDGCYKDTFETLQEGSVLYSRSGAATEPEVGVVSLTTDDGDFNWFIGFLDIGGTKGSQAFCFSVESASDVDPGNASWICDFTGNNENFRRSSEEEMTIVCGSCTEVAPDGASQDASLASKVGVGIFAAGGAGVVSVSFSLAGWF